jgi:hypothetical protein
MIDKDAVIEFNPSAFKHDVSEYDIRVAISRYIYDEIMAGDEEKNLLLGFDSSMRLLEVIYNIIDENTVNVFHAEKCRRGYRKLVGL